MKRFFALFVLTPREQRIVIFMVIALVVGAWIKHYREMQAYDVRSNPESSPAPFVSPTPDGR